MYHKLLSTKWLNDLSTLYTFSCFIPHLQQTNKLSIIKTHYQLFRAQPATNKYNMCIEIVTRTQTDDLITLRISSFLTGYLQLININTL